MMDVSVISLSNWCSRVIADLHNFPTTIQVCMKICFYVHNRLMKELKMLVFVSKSSNNPTHHNKVWFNCITHVTDFIWRGLGGNEVEWTWNAETGISLFPAEDDRSTSQRQEKRHRLIITVALGFQQSRETFISTSLRHRTSVAWSKHTKGSKERPFYWDKTQPVKFLGNPLCQATKRHLNDS